jgi:predicted enzyme related to lactoylglutathione lyase
MNEEQGLSPNFSSNPFKSVGVNYVSLYVKDFEAAVEFYSRVLNPPTYVEKDTCGWKMRTTWLTIFPSK